MTNTDRLPQETRFKLRKLYFCTVCGRLGAEDKAGVCPSCEAKIEHTHNKAEAERARLWAERHKCQCCGIALPVSRQLHCEYCQPKEIEDDGLGDTDMSGPVLNRNRRRVNLPTEQCCTQCGVTKPISDFEPRGGGHYQGYRKRCRACRNSYKRMRYTPAQKEASPS